MKPYKILIAAALVLTTAGCKKVIDIQETDLIAGQVSLKTVQNNESALMSGYAGLAPEMSYLLNSVLSDEVKNAEFYNSATVHEWQYSPSDVPIRDNYTAMVYYYRVIDRVNRVLEALPTAQATVAGDEALRSKVRGEALFIRAFSHFDMFRYYAGNYTPDGLALPYMQTPSLGNQVRIKMSEYFQKLNADLAEAKNLVPNNLTDKARANRTAVSGLQARVALYMKDWANAITYSTEYITALPLASAATFPGIFTDANTNEVALTLKRSSSNNPYLQGNVYSNSGVQTRIGTMYRAASASATNIGTVIWTPSNKLYNSYTPSDVRFTTFIKDEPLLAAASRPSRLVNKYAGTTYGSAGENVADAKVFRTGEMYLIRAEAKAETNDLIGAAGDVNTLRAARITGYVPVVFATAADAITAIMDERFKELAFEGHRFWDLKRRGLPVVRLASDAPNASATTLPANHFRFVLPIPEPEILANPSLQQNPGYN
jgi:starch-binding outer membrane protein, SusD/RagB family